MGIYQLAEWNMHHIKAHIHNINTKCIKFEVVEGQRELGREEKSWGKKEKQWDVCVHPKYTLCKKEVSTRRTTAIDKPLLSPQATETQY